MCLERRRDGGLSMHSLHFSAALSASHTLIHCVMLLLWVSQCFCALVKWPQHFTIMGSEHENTLKPDLPPLSCSLFSTLIMSLYEIFSSHLTRLPSFPQCLLPLISLCQRLNRTDVTNGVMCRKDRMWESRVTWPGKWGEKGKQHRSSESGRQQSCHDDKRTRLLYKYAHVRELIISTHLVTDSNCTVCLRMCVRVCIYGIGHSSRMMTPERPLRSV